MRENLEISERIAKRLSRAGVASRRESEKLVLAGLVNVNGLIVTDPATKVILRDVIKVEGRLIAPTERTRLWIYHKPAGLVTSDSDEKGRVTIYNRLPGTLPRVMSVGRLDITSEGLLLLTNDGELKRKLELPKTGFIRKYRVRAKGFHSESSLEVLREGVNVSGERFRPMTVKLDREQGANIWYTVGLSEGRNREIRRAFEQINLNVNRLIRISYGPFQLGTLSRGEVKEVAQKVLRDQLSSILP